MELKRFLESDALTELLEALKADQPPLADLPVSSAPPDAHRANLALMVKAFETHMPEALLGGGSDPQAKASFWLAVNDRSPQTPLFLSRKASSESYQCVHDCWYTVFSRRLSNVRDRELKRKKRVEKMAQPALLPRAAEPPMASQEVVLMRQRCARMGTRVEELNERVDELETELSQAVEHVRDFSARLERLEEGARNKKKRSKQAKKMVTLSSSVRHLPDIWKISADICQISGRSLQTSARYL
jgi:hypothetical protein